MMQVHAQLQARAFPNCRKLAAELEVSSKTIQRDIDFMRDRLGLPIEYDQQSVHLVTAVYPYRRWSYYVHKRGYGFARLLKSRLTDNKLMAYRLPW